MSDREPVSHAVAHIIEALDIIAEMALDGATYAEVAAEERAIGVVRARAVLILDFIDTRKPSKIRMVR
jgi:hypothetical protein